MDIKKVYGESEFLKLKNTEKCLLDSYECEFEVRDPETCFWLFKKEVFYAFGKNAHNLVLGFVVQKYRGCTVNKVTYQ